MEGVGFEPTVPMKVRRFSRPVHSAALSPLRIGSQAWTRTRDIRINSPVFYQLNYLGTNWSRYRDSNSDALVNYDFYRTIQRIIKVIATIIKILGGNIIYFVVTLCSFSNSFTLEYVLSCNP